ncbi:RusA family crossover junction endodeoxyribonuclease [Staphylococcus condimenti]|uniref:RusA family crossover junction endodeoxyribonuclease n=1 Tax=Staphylococcus condimenti TaxID=70255 RepID=A0AB37H569_9STAP|nr:RusA family crossover junction endodeoxyribonuclease [Staphylococcus condimenti]QQS82952.1 RusA family crossover junction endodeoxyribonuclease [Staphylococcus condimenti]QRP94613.1 RusA family crossover junction endodeoxyribonuclease [Staphylococcus condimenti]
MFKGITDSLNGICYEDDKQIITGTMGKFYAEKDYMEITITEVG